ncbi:MAG TPA: tRNA (adenosine(37)-N6)-dimethylallyltransferase MiaA [Marmoricola sp.]|nr:tRNA (adenosine(37)-N6)-dimethylallyltransferase MiaA [Nocardioidaceae bacterium]HMU35261.1 tRNA (adenosine(37)-N6)-dimethylallyltransferase MiaA [Marmoricola sp.]MCB8993004.1 tRNA (adenosine(37)-N6)-dimethylallyltransferase MiaA [Nocardioidaceae bacterium]MCO5323493.1 tRNA (adenosine(37)-N6)-dimethylallyltransferase MiaA [Nocardioidaceae bacterium]HMY08529.1 tRNA (adenosine(37)-N6)-dimethylallyltransferase MiaA [Marmoricola sp.]
MSTHAQPVVAVVGATAAGKSSLALTLAQRIGGEVVNTDSMQIYRGMDIGTAKLPVEQRLGIPHHLLDLLDPSEPVTVAEFQQWARQVIADCHARGVTPILVGGSALYTRAILDVFEFPGTDAQLRAKWEARLSEVGSLALHEELRQIDPAAADQVLPTNSRRIVRALEVIELTGKPFVATLPTYSYHYPGAVQIGLSIDRATLHARIEARVHAMWAAGFVAEVRGLLDHGLAESRTASRALGYSQILRHLSDEITEEQAMEQTITGTRRFARRQDSWFLKDPRITWVDHADPSAVDQALALLAA